MGLSEFEVNLVFRMSSKAARATERSPISEKKRGRVNVWPLIVALGRLKMGDCEVKSRLVQCGSQ